MILAIKTDTAAAELTLLGDDGLAIDAQHHEFGRQMARQLPAAIQALVTAQGRQMDDLSGVLYFSGPGSFTGLRIGAATANALAYGLGVPIVAERGDDWLKTGLSRLQSGESEVTALPFYGAEAHVTAPRK